MPVIRNGAIVEDAWRHLADDDPIPAEGAIFVSLQRWQAERAALSQRAAPVGVRLASGEAAETLAGDLDRLAAVALAFPSFTDGRSYSTARILRQHLGYAGEIRAVGNVLRDQLAPMARCGIDAWEVPAGRAGPAWLTAFSEIPVRYQRAADARETVFSSRHARTAADS